MSDKPVFACLRKHNLKFRTLTLPFFVVFLLLYAGGLWIISVKATTTYLKVNMQSSSPGVAQLYYDTGSGYSEASSVQVNIYDGVHFSEYYFRLPRQKIFQFRFDPSLSAGRFVIRRIEVVSRQGVSTQSIALHQVQPAHQIREHRLMDQDLQIVTEEQANDPQLIINLQQPLHVSKTDLLLNPMLLIYALSLFPIVLLSMAIIAWGWRKINLEWFFCFPSHGCKYIQFAVCVIISLIILSGIHRQSYSDALRYTRVAEGNISQVVHGMWSSGPSVFADTIHGDAQTWGRIRPAHWLFYNIPYALTLARNGDLFCHDALVPISKRINGDLQTHTLFLILCMAIACGGLAWLVYRFTDSWLAFILFPLYVGLGFPLCENLLVNYCDSQEIPQLLWISLYLISIKKAFSSQKPRWHYEFLASGFLLLAYATKETSLILFPLFSVVFGYLFFASAREEHAFRRFCMRQWFLLAIFSIILIAFISAFRSGAYVSKNYVFNWQNLWPSVLYSFSIFRLGIPWWHLSLLAMVPLSIFLLYHVIRKQISSTRNSGIMLIMFICIGLALGFWLLILPWEVRLAKYYLPVVFWGSLAAVVIQIFIADQLHRRGYRKACAIWILVTCIYLLADSNRLNDNIQRFYEQAYGYRQSVPIISKDIAATLKTRDNTHRVHIIVDPLFQEGALPFQRQVNLLYGINIALKGKPVRHVESSERNYFRSDPGRPSVEITLSQSLPKKSYTDYMDLIYICRFPGKQELLTSMLENMYCSKQWVDAYRGLHIEKYERTNGLDKHIL